MKRIAASLPASLSNDVEIQIGICDGGTFIAIKHHPTGIRVYEGPIGRQKSNNVVARLGRELMDKINAKKSRTVIRKGKRG